jgi:hypothetical protein
MREVEEPLSTYMNDAIIPVMRTEGVLLAEAVKRDILRFGFGTGVDFVIRQDPGEIRVVIYRWLYRSNQNFVLHPTLLFMFTSSHLVRVLNTRIVGLGHLFSQLSSKRNSMGWDERLRYLRKPY